VGLRGLASGIPSFEVPADIRSHLSARQRPANKTPGIALRLGLGRLI